jgi:hypothetical protein
VTPPIDGTAHFLYPECRYYKQREDFVKKVQITAVFWTLVIGIPFTALALMASAFISDHLIQISTGLASISHRLFAQGRDLVLEAELSGMVAGLILIVAIGVATYLLGQKGPQNKTMNNR